MKTELERARSWRHGGDEEPRRDPRGGWKIAAARDEPNEEALESLLANLVICLQSLLEINSLIVTANGQSASLAGGLKSVSGLANEICGDCVPHSYAPALKESMDQIQELARKIA